MRFSLFYGLLFRAYLERNLIYESSEAEANTRQITTSRKTKKIFVLWHKNWKKKTMKMALEGPHQFDLMQIITEFKLAWSAIHPQDYEKIVILTVIDSILIVILIVFVRITLQ